MHETFQHELNRLRLLAAKTLLEVHVKSDNSIAVGALEPIRLTAEVIKLLLSTFVIIKVYFFGRCESLDLRILLKFNLDLEYSL